ncbi:MAG: fimbrillin family protein [Muribaculaceae bacterium]|nr:fimbrillin family protein [Muribaculaceae bacterium]
MNRKSFATAASLSILATIFTACTADEDINQLNPASASESNAITFRVDNPTPARSASSREVSTSVTDFKVSAIDRGNAYFSSPVSVFQSGGSWTSTGKTYWPEDRALTFVAFVDQNTYGSSFVISGGTASFSDYEVPSDVNDQTDLMYAVASDVRRDSSNGGVSLRFRHALAQVSFSAQNNSPVYESVEILSIELGGVKGKGTYTFPQSSTGSAGGSWTLDADASDRSYSMDNLGVTLGSCDASCRGEKVNVCGGTRSENDGVMYMIPQETGDGAYIKVKARMTLKDVPGASYETEEIIPVSANWKEGQRYNYTIAWNATPITFDVKVADFKEVTVNAD